MIAVAAIGASEPTEGKQGPKINISLQCIIHTEYRISNI